MSRRRKRLPNASGSGTKPSTAPSDHTVLRAIPESQNRGCRPVLKVIRYRGGLPILLVILVVLFAALPLGSAIRFGGDEGFELMKAFLNGKGFALYKEIWDDQPPLFTLLLDWSFQAFGTSILTARFLAAAFGLLLFTCFFDLIRQRAGTSAAWLACFFLIASPFVLELSVSVMQEVPTFALVLLSAWLLPQSNSRPYQLWIFGSGLVMGLALGIKLIAVLAVPAVLAEMLSMISTGSSGLKKFIMTLLKWAVPTLLIFVAITLTWGIGSFQTSMKAHFGHQTRVSSAPSGEKPQDFRLSGRELLEHADCIVPALAGLVLAYRSRKIRQGAIPITWLVAALTVAFFHRPWWRYYYLHLAIPFSWLAGIALAEAIALTSLFLEERPMRLGKTAFVSFFITILSALALARSFGRLESAVQGLRNRPRADTSAIITKLKETAGPSDCVYADDPIYPFHAGLRMPPELAVVTLKRYWSGQITTAEIVEICQKRGVRLAALARITARQPIWNTYLLKGSSPIWDADGWQVWLRKVGK